MWLILLPAALAGGAEPVASLERDAAGLVLPWIRPPDGVVAPSWELHGVLRYGERRLTWTQVLTGEPPWEVVLPPELYFDGYQRDWLSSLHLRLYPTDGLGALTRQLPVERLWVVWPDGATAVWLDEAGRRVEAPNGAWSASALATVPIEDVGDPNVEIAPPVGGAR